MSPASAVPALPGVATPTDVAPPDLVPFLDAILRPDGAASVRDDLPLLFGDDPRAFRRALRDPDGRTVAHAAAYLHDVRLRPPVVGAPSPERRIAVVAAVATHPKRRRRGLASRVVEALLADAALRGADAAVLWSEADALYRRLGFAPFGVERVLVADPSRFPPPERGRVRPARPEDLDAMRALHDAEPARALKDRRTWEILLATPRTDAYVLERDAATLAFGVVGRGADLARTLHTWGGEERLLPDLCGGVLALRGEDELYVLAPSWRRRARDLFLAREAPVRDGPLCMLKPLVGVDGAPRRAIPEDAFWLTGLDSM